MQPAKESQEKRLGIALTPQGFDTVKRKAAAAGKPVSTYVREILGVESPHDLNYKRRVPIPESFFLSEQAPNPEQAQVQPGNE